MPKNRIDVDGMFSKMVNAGENGAVKKEITAVAAAPKRQQPKKKNVALTIQVSEDADKMIRIQGAEKEKGKNFSQIAERGLDMILWMSGDFANRLAARAELEGVHIGELIERMMDEKV